MRKRFTILITITVLLSFASAFYVNAQSTAAQKALEEVKDSVSTLIGAKDENSPIETGLRVETFKKVLDFSTTETKDLKLKLLSYDEFSTSTSTATSSLSAWGKSSINKLNNFLTHYDNQKTEIEKSTYPITPEDIKTKAENFKKWREESYLPIVDEITNFLLIEQQDNAIETTENRWQKVNSDVIKLKKIKFKKIGELDKLLKKAGESIEEAKILNKRARELFKETYLSVKTNAIAKNATSSVTSTLPISSSSIGMDNIKKSDEELTTKNTTETKQEEKKESAEPTILQSSIKDLVKDSLTKVKDTYQNFIEMSNLVRKLLG